MSDGRKRSVDQAPLAHAMHVALLSFSSRPQERDTRDIPLMLVRPESLSSWLIGDACGGLPQCSVLAGGVSFTSGMTPSMHVARLLEVLAC